MKLEAYEFMDRGATVHMCIYLSCPEHLIEAQLEILQLELQRLKHSNNPSLTILDNWYTILT